ncbi:protein of unknown function DUF2157 [Nostoc flagelliforme CCNUN1]|uniref:DUF2157 domain-containing protein n=1 Tax=Nostoc flagelliforme CCNUN1 TaxID=2038116 RepID=A0A2K8SFW6_9NOSO|nr:DUF2157 domain-containing protein [Nostoc flagelliforme]AUB34354.1 protein of unknown function DUF2157 [Nostoc flagelliforme CCNUN1]
MSSPLERPLKLEIRLPSDHPHLLEGLDIWLRLGLISDTQVKQLCREFLVCTVVLQPQPEAETKVAFVTSDSVQQLPVATLQSSSRRQPPQQKPAKPNLISTMLQSLGAELSVRWLLFLGVFLVVVSSGVLAASQWERFPASGQYGVLFAYTLSFWGLSFWATRQSNLRLTAQTLLIVTLLLVPVNFWAMDSFRLWQNPKDWIVVAIACPSLTAITILLSKNRSIFPNLLTGKLPLINILGLNYLHWGWQLRGFPLIAVYVAMIGTTIITVYHNYQQPNPISEEDRRDVYDGLRQRQRLSISLSASVIIYALIVLLVRAIFVAKVDVTQLGLAIGICGWLVTWLAQQGRAGGRGQGETIQNDARGLANAALTKFKIQNYSPSSPPFPSSLLLWERLGGILLFLGWLVSVVNYPMSAIAVSALGLWFVGSRLRQYSFKVDFAAVFVIGLQMIWLGWRLVPDSLQKLAIATGTQLTNSQNEPWALLSVALFPYIILMVALTDRLHRSQKRELAKFGELLTLLFGAFLTTIAIINPALRSLNLLFSTITLAFVTQRRSPSSLPLIYLTHIIGVLTFCFTINWLLPTLSQPAWASILLALMVAEWVFSLTEGLWQRSGWDIGLGLAAASFFLLWMNAESSWYGIADSQANWGVLWLVTPIALTGVANATIIERRLTSRYLSVLAVVTAQLLTLQLPETRLIGLSVGTGLMFANTRYLRNQISAVITEGFLLSFIVALLWVDVPGLPRLALAGWFVVGAIAILILWLARTILNRRGNELAIIYAAASDKWAIALCGFELFGLTLNSILIYSGFITSGFFYLAATAIILVAIVYRSWREPTNWAFYGIGWSLELLTAQVLGFGERSTLRIAFAERGLSIANIALGLTAQLVGEWWRRNSQTSPSIFGGITIAEMWVYLGLLEVAGMRVYWRETAVGRFWAGPLVPWNGAIACVVAYFLYILPWESWGWSKRPWQQAAYIIPLISLWETRLQVYPITLLLAAGFYIFLAKVGENIRFTYISVALIDWALYRWFDSLRLTDALWYVTPIGFSLLYIAQVDTQLKLPEYKAARHILRVIGSGLICGWAILFNQDTAWIPGIFSLIAIFAGLALRVRAFLYIGTATFLITTIYQSVIFSLQYSFLKWVVGLLVGILLIYIAANFETRRAQITSLIRSAIDEFQSWE